MNIPKYKTTQKKSASVALNRVPGKRRRSHRVNVHGRLATHPSALLALIASVCGEIHRNFIEKSGANFSQPRGRVVSARIVDCNV